MNEQFMKQLIAELIEAQGQALGILTQALCQQVDPARLKTDLQKTLASAKLLKSHSTLTDKLVAHAQAAAQAAQTLQARPRSEGPYPKREG